VKRSSSYSIAQRGFGQIAVAGMRNASEAYFESTQAGESPIFAQPRLEQLSLNTLSEAKQYWTSVPVSGEDF